VKQSISKLISRFSRDVRGGVALMAGLTFPVLFVAVGGTIDYTRAVSNTTKVQSAMDSAVLALTRKDPGTFDVQDEGTKIFNSFISNRELGVDASAVEFSINGKTITGKANAETKTFFLTIIGTPTMGGSITSSAIPPSRLPIEISLVLDVSGSMNKDLNGETRIAHMKTAVNGMFDTLEAELPTETKLSVALVPYSSSVNLTDYRGALKAGSMGGQNLPIDQDVWAAERLEASNGNSYTLRDLPPAAVKVPFVLADEMVHAKPNARLAALSENVADIRTDVNALTANGWTGGHLGMIWGFYTLTPKWKQFWPVEPAKYGEADKIIVLLSDGEFNTTFNIGDSLDMFEAAGPYSPEDLMTQRNNFDEANAYFLDVCSLARESGMTIYAVALSDGADIDKLTACTGSSGAVYPANSAEELSAAFKDIALTLGQRRLTN